MNTNPIPEFSPLKEYAIGDKFVLNDFVFVVKYPSEAYNCNECSLKGSKQCTRMRCKSRNRQDRTNVYFDFDDELRILLKNANVGDIVAYRGYSFKVKKSENCNKCYFDKYGCCLPCFDFERNDNTNVIFVLVDD